MTGCSSLIVVAEAARVTRVAAVAAAREAATKAPSRLRSETEQIREKPD